METSTLVRTTELTATQRAVVRALLYFDVFHYPLREQEIARFMDVPQHDRSELRSALEELCLNGQVEEHNGTFALRDPRINAERRALDNARAQKRMAKARRMSRFIGRFPYVRAVMLSGSISKGVMAKDGDIDYFVVTEPGRLWIARTLLIGFKKLFLFNSRKDFCVNYFVDTDHLAIEDRNLFTATEVLTLIPTYNGPVCAAFFRANQWAKAVLPNAGEPTVHDTPASNGILKRGLERMMRGGLGDEFDEWCMHRTINRWRNKFPEFDREKFDLALRSRRYVSKHHPQSFQEKVLLAFAERINWFEDQHGLSVA